ncbi:MAG: C45 family autoproteolytic acyltransferase/hydrolase [Candidatus Cloacimonetes bacterium]|nr:C45 family autoproteolytic acyltransferase/hydrolase [Candidatus Cloacimonadota bacterium]
MRKLIKKFVVTIIFTCSLTLFFAELKAEKCIAEFESGELFRSGKVNVLSLHGNYHQMGRQYGFLLKEELQDLYQSAIVEYFQETKSVSSELMIEMAMSFYELYPQRFKEIFLGMAETSGLTLEEHMMLNSLERYGSLSGCSGIIAWDDYAGVNPLIIGRNYDWFDKYTEFAQTLTVTVFNPDSGISNAIVTFAGIIYLTTGMNEDGIFMELNNGLPSGGTLSYHNRIPAIVSLFSFLNDYSSIEQIDAAFNTTRNNFAFIINVADKKQGRSYEWAPFEHRRRNGDNDGLLVATNHFADPSWGIILQDTAGFKTESRRENLLLLGEKNKGKIDTEVMKIIMDTPLEEGGATWPDSGSIRTVYQIITIPELLQIWVKVPGYQNWTKVDLDKYFTE